MPDRPKVPFLLQRAESLAPGQARLIAEDTLGYALPQEPGAFAVTFDRLIYHLTLQLAERLYPNAAPEARERLAQLTSRAAAEAAVTLLEPQPSDTPPKSAP